MADPSMQSDMQMNMAKQEKAMKKWEKATRHTYVALRQDQSVATDRGSMASIVSDHSEN